MMCLGVGLFGFILFGILSFLDLIFPSPSKRSFQSLFVQIGSESLVLSLLLISYDADVVLLDVFLAVP